MAKFQTDVTLQTSLKWANNNIKNKDNYIEYLSEKLYNDCTNKMTTTYESEDDFNSTELTIYIEKWFVLNSKYELTVYASFELDRFSSEDKYDNKSYDYIIGNKNFMRFIYLQVEKFVKTLNDEIDICYPINENLVYDDEHLYMEIDISSKQHIPDFAKLSITNDINMDDLEYSLIIVD